MARHHCLFLLGRPGAGKTTEMKRLASGEQAGFSDEELVIVSSREFSAKFDVELQRMPRWRNAVAQPKPVRLILDALDEGFLRSGDYFEQTRCALENLRAEMPALRLALICRPAEWNPAFAASVHGIWNCSGEPAIFALEPLMAESRRVLVENRGLTNTTAFFRWVSQNQLDEFASWPRSLEWLADQFRDGGAENITYSELCRRRVARCFGEDTRIEAAGRADRMEAWTHSLMLLAALIVFCGRKGLALDGPASDCLTLDEMFSGTESLKTDGKPPISRELLREAVPRASHLIESHDGYYRFQNQSDLEYLAAAMLVSLDVEHLSELFGCPDGMGSWRVFPQLASVAANLAGQSRIFFNWLLKRDPRVLMRVDFASRSEEERRNAVEEILKATAKADATGGHDQNAHFTTLWHPAIEKQLADWMFDIERSFAVRDLAFDIAYGCCGKTLWHKLERAAASGDDFAEQKLPLIISQFGNNWNDEKLCEWAGSKNYRMAGAALNALLDRGWKPRNLSQFLREPSGHVVGLYELYIYRLKAECTPEDVPAILDCVRGWRSVGETHGRVRDLVLALLSKGAAALHQSEVRTAMAKFLISRFKDYDFLIESDHFTLDTAEKRRALLLALLDIWPPELPGDVLPIHFPVSEEDHGWLLKEMAVRRGSSAAILAHLAAHVAWHIADEHQNLLEIAYKTSPEFCAQLPPAEENGILSTLRRLRAETEEKLRVQKEQVMSRREVSDYRHEEHFTRALDACRAGNLEAWTDLCFALSQPKSAHDDDAFVQGTDIRRLAGWRTATEELRVELAGIARGFLLCVEIQEPPAGYVLREFFAVVFALSLHSSRLHEDAELRAAIQPSWLQAISRHVAFEVGRLPNVLSLFTAIAPSVMAEGWGREFRDSWERNESISGHLPTFAWSEATESALVAVLERAPLQPESYRSGLKLLAKHNAPSARGVALKRLTEHLNQPDRPDRRAAIAACLFVVNELWKNAWAAFIGDPVSARELLLEISKWLDLPRGGEYFADLPTEFIAAFYRAVLQLLPPKDAPRHEGAHFYGPLEHAYQLHAKLQRILESRGAEKELRQIYEHNDELRGAWWIGNSLETARTAAHAQRRAMPGAVDFVRLITTEGGTFVCDNDSLQRAVLGSLRRFEKAMHPHGIVALWEKGNPRSEEVLQVEITRHLKREFEERRVVVNMEAKVEGFERSDIRVDAAPYSVIIEVKLGHSKDKLRPVREAMQTQLRDTYLANLRQSHGIYVVGWFFCPVFRSRGLSDMRTINAAQSYFHSQAQVHSTDGYSLAACVLDCRFHDGISARATRGRQTKMKKKLQSHLRRKKASAQKAMAKKMER